MRESLALVDTLKRILREQKITYARVATHLDISEASVKRLFTKGGFTLERLENICSLAQITLSELMERTSKRPAALTRLTAEQERELVEDPALLLVTFLTLNGFGMEEITSSYTLNEQEVLGHLLKLDKLGMIQLLPGNRVRRLVARNFAWHPHGPVQHYFEGQIRKDFLKSKFDQPGEHMRFAGSMLSRDSITRLHLAMDDLLTRIDELAQADADLPIAEKYGVGIVLASRPWEIPDFTAFRRNPRQLPHWDD